MENAATNALGQLVSSGILGSLLVVVGFLYYQKDRELQKQSRDNLALIMALQREIITAVTKMSDLVEFIERREREREIERARDESNHARRAR